MQQIPDSPNSEPKQIYNITRFKEIAWQRSVVEKPMLASSMNEKRKISGPLKCFRRLSGILLSSAKLGWPYWYSTAGSISMTYWKSYKLRYLFGIPGMPSRKAPCFLPTTCQHGLTGCRRPCGHFASSSFDIHGHNTEHTYTESTLALSCSLL